MFFLFFTVEVFSQEDLVLRFLVFVLNDNLDQSKRPIVSFIFVPMYAVDTVICYFFLLKSVLYPVQSDS
jgi:hypothetical protein